LIALVRVGLGTALVPAFTIADETAIVGVPVAGDVPRLEIALVTSGQRSRLSLASFAVVAALAFVQPRPEAIAPAPASHAPQHAAAAPAAEVASSGRWVAVSGRA
jgi:hypothetical protein